MHVGKRNFISSIFVCSQPLLTLNQRKFHETRIHMYIDMQPVIIVRKDAVQVRAL